jgi:hypothetical protein
MSNPYEILLRWRDGVFSGGHAVFIDGSTPGHPEPLGGSAHPWPDVLKGINLDAITGHQEAVDAQQAAEKARESAEAERDEAVARAGSMSDRFKDEQESHALTVSDLGKTIDGLNDELAATKEALRIAKLPPAEQRKLALEEEMATLEKELSARKAAHAELLDPPTK